MVGELDVLSLQQGDAMAASPCLTGSRRTGPEPACSKNKGGVQGDVSECDRLAHEGNSLLLEVFQQDGHLAKRFSCRASQTFPFITQNRLSESHFYPM